MSTMNIEIQPSNSVSTGLISYVSGSPEIRFDINETDRFLIGSSVRFCGEIQIYKDAGTTIPLATDQLNISPKLSTYAILDQLIIRSATNKSVIEHLRNYNRFLASWLPHSTSEQESIGHLGESSGMLPNTLANRLSFCNNVNDGAYKGNSFAVSLPCGLLNSQDPIPLSSRWGIGGCSISLMLSPDVNALYSNNASLTGLTNAHYELRNVKLIAELMTPAPDELSRLMSQTSGTMEYNAISSYYTSINSTNAIINMRLALQRVLGVWMNFIPSTMLNNMKYDSLQTLPLINNLATGTIAPINSINFLKGGSKFPLEYSIYTGRRDNNNIVNADPQQARNFMSAFSSFSKNRKQQLSPSTFNDKSFDNTNNFANAGQFNGVGVSYDAISDEGVNFSNEAWGCQIECELTEDNPQSVFIFVHNKQTLAWNQNGLQVIQ